MTQRTLSPARPLNTLVDRRTAPSARHTDLGVDPPIDTDGGRHSALDRHRVSVRWFCGTVLTGLAGASLIGAALVAALGLQSTSAEQPQMSAAHREAAAEIVNPRKGDRLVKSVDIVAAKQTFRTPTTQTIGDKEVVRNRAFTRISTPLTLTPTGLADEVPTFNPLRLLSCPTLPAPTRRASCTKLPER